MSLALRKGWCPGALRPMAAADGLVVRLRLTGGILASETAQALAALAARHGNGRLDLTSRANLQIRGVGEATLPALLDALRALGLADADAEAEAVRNVIASPLAGLHDGLDIRPLVAALEARLTGTPALHALPQKFGFLVDDGGVPSLARVAADVRFDWRAEMGSFAIGLGGTRADALSAGVCAAHDLVDCAEAFARGAIAGFACVPEARRMNTLLAALGRDELSRLCGACRHSGAARSDTGSTRVSDRTRRNDSASPLRVVRVEDTLSLGAPYGRLDAKMLHAAARLARASLGLRLTPWRSLLLPAASSPQTRERARQAGWIVDEADPRLAIAACVGAPECDRATVNTRADADALADLAAAIGGERPALHVSGCTKGCAHASAIPFVLVGRSGRYDLVRDGRAGDTPIMRDLHLPEARAALAALLPPRV